MSNAALALKSNDSRSWMVAAVGDVCRLINGRAYKKAELLADGRYRVLRVGNFFTNDHWYFSDLELEADKYCEDGDLLYAWSASFGPRIWTEEKVIYHYHIWKVQPDATKVSRDFLFYFFEWDKDLIRKEQGAGATMTHVSKESMEARAISLPPLEEQKRIVAVLDQAFAALDRARVNAEANLADTEELFVSELREKFRQASIGNARLSFDQLCDTLTPSIKIKRADYLDEGNYPIVSQEAESVSGYWNDPGALLGIERPVVVFGDHTRCLKYIDFDFVVGADGTKIMQPESGISAGYLYFGLRSQSVPEDGYARHFKFVRERTLPDISFREQEDLAQALFDIEEKCKGLEASYQTKLADIAALRQSLLQQAFAGEL